MKNIIAMMIVILFTLTPHMDSFSQTDENELDQGTIQQNLSLPLVLDIEGEKDRITTTTEMGRRKVIRKDALLDKGDNVTVPAGTSLRLGYENGAEVLITENSSIKTVIDENLKDDSETPMIDLLNGKIQAFFNNESKTPSKKYKFIIKTKNSVMGVRGTEFVLEHDGEKSSLHTTEGSVDFSENRESLREGNLKKVSKGNFIQRNKKEKIGKSKKFDRDKFMKKFRDSHPRLAKLRERAKEGRKSGKRREKFKKAKQRFKKKIRQAREGRKYRRQKRRDKREGRSEKRQDKREGRSEKRQDKREGRSEKRQDKREGRSEKRQDKREGRSEKRQGRAQARPEKKQNRREGRSEKRQGRAQARPEKKQNRREGRSEKRQGRRGKSQQMKQKRKQKQNSRPNNRLSKRPSRPNNRQQRKSNGPARKQNAPSPPKRRAR